MKTTYVAWAAILMIVGVAAAFEQFYGRGFRLPPAGADDRYKLWTFAIAVGLVVGTLALGALTWALAWAVGVVWRRRMARVAAHSPHHSQQQRRRRKPRHGSKTRK